MRHVLVITVAFATCFCGATTVHQRENTYFSEHVETELPPRPDTDPIPAGDAWVVSVEAGETVQRSGLCMSDAKAIRSARYVVSYNELRGLYQSDLHTWNRERDIYQRYLADAETEIEHWREQSKRTWWERNESRITLVVGVVVGAGMAIGLVYGINQVASE